MAEIGEMRRYAAEGLSISRTARLLGRTRKSLGAAASRYGIRFRCWEDNGAPHGNQNRKGKKLCAIVSNNPQTNSASS